MYARIADNGVDFPQCVSKWEEEGQVDQHWKKQTLNTSWLESLKAFSLARWVISRKSGTLSHLVQVVPGPTLKSIMTNCNGKLDDIKNIALENGSGGEMRFVTHLVNLNALNSAVNTKVLDLQKVKEIVDELRENFFQMQTEFNLSQTLKLHILFDHYVEHEMTGESL